jgi:hypothetical protein
VTGWVRRWYRIAAAVTTGVALAALTLGASGQLFAPGVPPSTTKAVLTQDAGAQNAGTPNAGPPGPADDTPRRCAQPRRTGRRPRTSPRARCQSTRRTAAKAIAPKPIMGPEASGPS